MKSIVKHSLTAMVMILASLGSTYAKAAEPTCVSTSSIIAEVSEGGLEQLGVPPSTYHYEAERAILTTKWTLAQADLSDEEKATLSTTTAVDIMGYPGKGWRILFSHDGCSIGLMDVSPQRMNKLFDIINGFHTVNAP